MKAVVQVEGRRKRLSVEKATAAFAATSSATLFLWQGSFELMLERREGSIVGIIETAGLEVPIRSPGRFASA